MERRLQSRLHILGAPVAEINGVSSPASASVRRRSLRISPGERSALAASEPPLLLLRMLWARSQKPAAQRLTSRMSSTTTHTPTGKLAAP